jgi:3-methyladenine DNA glycosylase AlkD
VSIRSYLKDVQGELRKLAHPEKAKILSGFFKTGKGDYGEGDLFLGITVPEQRKIAKKYSGLPLKDIRKLLSSKIHEYRLVALLMLIRQYGKSDERREKEIFDFYLANTRHINNWDLVDLSAPNIMGDYLLDKDRAIVYKLAKSDNLWEKRIAIMATFMFIRNNQFDDTFRIAEILLYDQHDLIQKAVGWMLRETGKRNQTQEEAFLKKYCGEMPRTMLRYAVERFDEQKRRLYLKRRSVTRP